MPRRNWAAVAAALAAVLLTATIAADLHAHVPHGEAGRGTALRAADEDLASSCAMCRLAHQVSSPAASAPLAGRPVAPSVAAARPGALVISSGIERSSSPRAPPAAASC